MQKTIARELASQQITRGHVLVAEGAHSDRFFAIVSGELDLTQEGRALR